MRLLALTLSLAVVAAVVRAQTCDLSTVFPGVTPVYWRGDSSIGDDPTLLGSGAALDQPGLFSTQSTAWTFPGPSAFSTSGYARLDSLNANPTKTFPASNTDAVAGPYAALSVCAFVRLDSYGDAQLFSTQQPTQIFGVANEYGTRTLGVTHEQCDSTGAAAACDEHRWLVQLNGTFESGPGGVRLLDAPAAVNRWEFVCAGWHDATDSDSDGDNDERGVAYLGSAGVDGTYYEISRRVAKSGNSFVTLGATDLRTHDGAGYMPAVFLHGAIDKLIVLPHVVTRDEALAYRNCYDEDGDGISNDDDKCPGFFNAGAGENDDNDSDGVGNACDNCPNACRDAGAWARDRNSDGEPDNSCPGVPPLVPEEQCDIVGCDAFLPNADQTDSDSDGVGDLCDNCPGLFNPAQVHTHRGTSLPAGDECFSGTCTDGDMDGVCEDYPPFDNCPDTPNALQSDIDGDGFGDACDTCPLTANPTRAGQDADRDNDGVPDACDNCPYHENSDQLNSDDDPFGDECDNCPFVTNGLQFDADSDGIGAQCDNCERLGTLLWPNPTQRDSDGDDVGDACDNCALWQNADQADPDSDGVGTACDYCLDLDGDTICTNVPRVNRTADMDPLDNCPDMPNFDQADGDSDGVGDACDSCADIDNSDQADGDSDGVGDVCDGCPTTYNSRQTDIESDGVQDACDNCPAVVNPRQEDSDSDGDGDHCEGTLSVRNVCAKVWRVENSRDDETFIRYDFRSGRVPRYHLVLAAHSVRLVTIAEHAASDGVDGSSAQHLFVWEKNDETPAVYENTNEGQQCLSVTPRCRGTYEVHNRIGDAVEIAWQTPVYDSPIGSTDAGALRTGVFVPGGNTAVVRTLGEHQREKLFVWMTLDGERVRRIGIFTNRYATACPPPLAVDSLTQRAQKFGFTRLADAVPALSGRLNQMSWPATRGTAGSATWANGPFGETGGRVFWAIPGTQAGATLPSDHPASGDANPLVELFEMRLGVGASTWNPNGDAAVAPAIRIEDVRIRLSHRWSAPDLTDAFDTLHGDHVVEVHHGSVLLENQHFDGSRTYPVWLQFDQLYSWYPMTDNWLIVELETLASNAQLDASVPNVYFNFDLESGDGSKQVDTATSATFNGAQVRVQLLSELRFAHNNPSEFEWTPGIGSAYTPAQSSVARESLSLYPACFANAYDLLADDAAEECGEKDAFLNVFNAPAGFRTQFVVERSQVLPMSHDDRSYLVETMYVATPDTDGYAADYADCSVRVSVVGDMRSEQLNTTFALNTGARATQVRTGKLAISWTSTLPTLATTTGAVGFMPLRDNEIRIDFNLPFYYNPGVDGNLLIDLQISAPNEGSNPPALEWVFSPPFAPLVNFASRSADSQMASEAFSSPTWLNNVEEQCSNDALVARWPLSSSSYSASHFADESPIGNDLGVTAAPSFTDDQVTFDGATAIVFGYSSTTSSFDDELFPLGFAFGYDPFFISTNVFVATTTSTTERFETVWSYGAFHGEQGVRLSLYWRRDSDGEVSVLKLGDTAPAGAREISTYNLAAGTITGTDSWHNIIVAGVAHATRGLSYDVYLDGTLLTPTDEREYSYSEHPGQLGLAAVRFQIGNAEEGFDCNDDNSVAGCFMGAGVSMRDMQVYARTVTTDDVSSLQTCDPYRPRTARDDLGYAGRTLPLHFGMRPLYDVRVPQPDQANVVV